MWSDRPAQPAPVPAPGAKVVNDVGHQGVGITLTRESAVETGAVKRLKTRQSIMPVTVFFFETPRTPLDAAADADIEAAVVSRASYWGLKERTRRTLVDVKGDRRRDRGPLVTQAGPPALGADIIGQRIGAPHPSK